MKPQRKAVGSYWEALVALQAALLPLTGLEGLGWSKGCAVCPLLSLASILPEILILHHFTLQSSSSLFALPQGQNTLVTSKQFHSYLINPIGFSSTSKRETEDWPPNRGSTTIQWIQGCIAYTLDAHSRAIIQQHLPSSCEEQPQ